MYCLTFFFGSFRTAPQVFIKPVVRGQASNTSQCGQLIAKSYVRGQQLHRCSHLSCQRTHLTLPDFPVFQRYCQWQHSGSCMLATNVNFKGAPRGGSKILCSPAPQVATSILRNVTWILDLHCPQCYQCHFYPCSEDT